MTSRRETLQKAIIEVQRAPQEHRRYGKELKRAITEYAMMQQDAGRCLQSVAAELQLSYGSVTKWVRHARRRQKQGRVAFER